MRGGLPFDHCFVTGPDFSRADKPNKNASGFSPCYVRRLISPLASRFSGSSSVVPKAANQHRMLQRLCENRIFALTC
jgi:hypothetical protein